MRKYALHVMSSAVETSPKNKRQKSILLALILCILINSLILFNQSHKLFKSPYPLWLEFTCIMKLSLLFYPIQHIMFLNSML